MSSATRGISSGVKPRVVMAGVPMRIPEVTRGGLGSKGMAFLFTVIPTASSLSSASFPVRPLGRRSTRKRWLSVPPVTMR